MPVLILSPTGITNHTNQGNLPILDLTKPMLPLVPHIEIPHSSLVKDPTHVCAATICGTLQVTSVKIVGSNCDGNLCNFAGLGDGTTFANGCACYNRRIAGKHPALVIDVKITDTDREIHHVRGFLNKYFQDTILTKGSSSGLNADLLNSCPIVTNTCQDKIQRIFDHGNANGGFSSSIWFKMGYIVDGVESNQKPSYGEEQSKVVTQGPKP